MIDKNMGPTWWLQIKYIMNLCNNKDHPPKGEAVYKPENKLYMIWNVLVHNVNGILEKADDDLCGDENT